VAWGERLIAPIAIMVDSFHPAVAVRRLPCGRDGASA
jgi:hypothetical protein